LCAASWIACSARLRFALLAMDPISLKLGSDFLEFEYYLIVFGNDTSSFTSYLFDTTKLLSMLQKCVPKISIVFVSTLPNHASTLCF